VIILYIIILGIVLLFLFSYINAEIYNHGSLNYIRVNFLIFKLHISDNKIKNIIKKFGFSGHAKLKEDMAKFKSRRPILKDIIDKTIVNEITIYKFVNNYNKTYEIITLYALSSYLKAYLVGNTKRVEKYKYNLFKSNGRTDFDFTLRFQVSIIDILISLGKNVLKKRKREMTDGS